MHYLVLSNPVEGVTHDRNEHVQHCDLGEERGQDKKQEAKPVMRLPREVLVVELAENQIVLVHKDVAKRIVQIILNEFLPLVPVEVEHVDGQAKDEQCREEQDHEGDNFAQRLCD